MPGIDIGDSGSLEYGFEAKVEFLNPLITAGCTIELAITSDGFAVWLPRSK